MSYPRLHTEAGRREAWAHCRAQAAPWPALAAEIVDYGPAQLRWHKGRVGLRETLARSIVSQQVSVAAADAIWNRLCAYAAAQNLDLYEAFARAPPEALRACGLSAAKARYLGTLARDPTTADSRAARAEAPEAFRARLIALPGVGPWTCDMAAIFWRREADVWPDGDLVVRTQFARLVGVDAQETAALARAFAPWRTMLALHMWEVAHRARAAAAASKPKPPAKPPAKRKKKP